MILLPQLIFLAIANFHDTFIDDVESVFKCLANARANDAVGLKEKLIEAINLHREIIK